MLLELLLLAGASKKDAADLGAPPELREPPGPTCRCPETVAAPEVILRGIVVDAELTLGEDGRSVSDRQATVITTARGDAQNTTGRIRVYHDVREGECGLTFDYGKSYSIPVRRDDAGRFETDQCLMAWTGDQPD